MMETEISDPVLERECLNIADSGRNDDHEAYKELIERNLRKARRKKRQKKMLLYIKWFLTGIGTICIIAGCGSDYWQSTSLTHEGLWRKCVYGKDYCFEVQFRNTTDGWLAQRNMKRVRGMIVSATVMGVVTFVLIVLGTFCSDWFIIIAYIFEFAICSILLAGMIIYTNALKVKGGNYQWSYVLAWLGGALFGVNLVCEISL